MAAFDAYEQKNETLHWVILRDGGIALYWQRQYLEQDLARFRQQNYQIHTFDCPKWTDGGVHADLQRAFSFPSHYGHNLHALNDCLQKGLSVPELEGSVIVLNQLDSFRRSSCLAFWPTRS
jgi:RNAse (barnase) inhibitor barstar